MKFNLLDIKDLIEVPFFAGIIFYLSMIKKRNFLENLLLLSAISFLIFDLSMVMKNMKKIKEKEENQYLEEYTVNDVENFEEETEEQLEYFIPSPEFEGQLENYIFTTRNEGTGYYLDI